MAHDAAAGPAPVTAAGPVGPATLEECALAYGRDLLAYLLGAGAGKPLAAWRLEGQLSKGVRDRLGVCHRVLQVFKDPRLARAWMRRPRPRFGGRTPAWAVRTGDPALLAAVEADVEREAGRQR